MTLTHFGVECIAAWWVFGAFVNVFVNSRMNNEISLGDLVLDVIMGWIWPVSLVSWILRFGSKIVLWRRK